jgi:hypothetical protein
MIILLKIKSSAMKKTIEALRQSIAQAMPILQSISEKEFSARLPDKWSKKQILGHLIDSALSNSRRFVLAQYESQPKVDYNADEWVALSNYQHYNKDSLIQLWKLLNEHICIILETMPEDKYENLCDSGYPELHTLKWLAEDYVVHLHHHLDQLREEGGVSSSQ